MIVTEGLWTVVYPESIKGDADPLVTMSDHTGTANQYGDRDRRWREVVLLGAWAYLNTVTFHRRIELDPPRTVEPNVPSSGTPGEGTLC